MPEFKRTYTTPFVTKVSDSIEWAAKRIEGATRVQSALAARGADQNDDGVYQIDSVTVKEQLGLLIDRMIRQNYRRWKFHVAVEAAEGAAQVDAAETGEDGGAA